MTQVQNSITVLHKLAKGTILSKSEYKEMAHQFWRENGYKEHCSNWEYIIANPSKYGVERMEEYYTTVTSKVGVLDVIEMMKQGYTVEQIEEKIYTQVKVISVKII